MRRTRRTLRRGRRRRKRKRRRGERDREEEEGEEDFSEEEFLEAGRQGGGPGPRGGQRPGHASHPAAASIWRARAFPGQLPARALGCCGGGARPSPTGRARRARTRISLMEDALLEAPGARLAGWGQQGAGEDGARRAGGSQRPGGHQEAHRLWAGHRCHWCSGGPEGLGGARVCLPRGGVGGAAGSAVPGAAGVGAAR